MSSDKLSNDSSPSSKALVYQFCVAVQKCYEMTANQRVLIEKQGDVTVPQEQQVETKHFSDSLTDGHKNFWNTLSNWLQRGFDETSYTSLILLTTQQFGEKATIASWNDSSTAARIQILESIHERFEHEQKQKEQTNPNAKPSAILSLQRFVLAPSQREKLTRVVGKFFIEACSPTLPALHALIKERHIKGIPTGNKDAFLNALIGFVAQPQTSANQSWEITYEQFDNQVTSLNTAFCRQTRVFPHKYFENANWPSEAQVQQHQQHLFVHKIRDINHHVVITEAITDYLSTLNTLKEEFSKYEVSPKNCERYVTDVVRTFRGRYRIASVNCTDVHQDSQIFFDERTLEHPEHFEGFDHTPRSFRNGVIHIQMDDQSQQLQWKLNPAK